MTREDILKKLNIIFQDVFDDNGLIITEKTSAFDIDEWDSFNHINLIVATEREFKIKFQVGEPQKMKNVGEMIDIIFERVDHEN